ncbi:MAG: flagellar hook-associated protein FlgK [Hyphomicrobium sp.]
MGLSLGLDVARSSLAVAGEQVSVVSRNIARINDPNATRKIAGAVTGPGAMVHLGRVDRVYDAVMLDKLLVSTSDASAQNEILSSVEELNATIGDTDLERSPAALIAKLGATLQQFSAAPYNTAAASAAVSSARDVASALNEGAQSADALRQRADSDIAQSASKITDLLARFHEYNNAVVQGTHRGADITDVLDARDGTLKELSAEIGITTLSRANGDLAIFTESGITLFDKEPRSVTFQPTPLLANGASGAAVYADGVPVSGAQHVLSISSGRLAGLVSVRDDVVPAYQKQLDEIARALVTAFAEHDQSALPVLPPVAGLFTYSGGPSIPAAGVLQPGLAGSISINPAVDPFNGGNAMLLRDGGISGNPAYVYNQTGAAGFTGRIDQMIAQLDTAQSFDAAAGLPSSASVTAFAKDSVSWLQTLRKTVSAEAEYRNTLGERIQAALSRDTGVSLDEEMTNMLELERTFQASSRLISAVDAMLEALISTVR